MGQAWGLTRVSKPELLKTLKRAYPYNVLTILPGGIREMFYGIKVIALFLWNRLLCRSVSPNKQLLGGTDSVKASKGIYQGKLQVTVSEIARPLASPERQRAEMVFSMITHTQVQT